VFLLAFVLSYFHVLAFDFRFRMFVSYDHFLLHTPIRLDVKFLWAFLRNLWLTSCQTIDRFYYFSSTFES